MTDFNFVPVRPRRWHGRHARIPGKTTALHVRLLDGRWWPSVEWVIDDEVAQCPMADVDDAESLADAVNAGKQLLGGSSGGAFLVNEYGQVLVSSPSGDGNVALVGECAGPMAFHDSFSGDDLFDLTRDQGLTLGDAWNLPYLGIPHNLSKTSELYFWHEQQAGGRKATPPVQDHSLIDALRALRPQGPIRFVVTYGGLVLTKVPAGNWKNTRWEPRFVGHIDYGRWYQKEV